MFLDLHFQAFVSVAGGAPALSQRQIEGVEWAGLAEAASREAWMRIGFR